MNRTLLAKLFERIKETIRENFPGLGGRMVRLTFLQLTLSGKEKGNGVGLLSNEVTMYFSFELRFRFSPLWGSLPPKRGPRRKIFLIENLVFFPHSSF